MTSPNKLIDATLDQGLLVPQLCTDICCQCNTVQLNRKSTSINEECTVGPTKSVSLREILVLVLAEASNTAVIFVNVLCSFLTAYIHRNVEYLLTWFLKVCHWHLLCCSSITWSLCSIVINLLTAWDLDFPRGLACGSLGGETTNLPSPVLEWVFWEWSVTACSSGVRLETSFGPSSISQHFLKM